jgi:predicted regulator of Ras-like GTPase activity (Roadblock/LC7/MglB family)
MDDQVVTTLRRLPGVAAVYVVGPDGAGTTATAAGLAGPEHEVRGALLAALVGALRQATGDLQLGDFGELLVEAGNGAIMAGALPDQRAAVVVTDAHANLGMVRVELRRLRRSL